jgi:hypothetical protein
MLKRTTVRAALYLFMTLLILDALPEVIAQSTPQSSSRVTSDRINRDLQEVQSVPDVRCQSSKDTHQLVCSSESLSTIWVFTTPGHPAHPAVVQRTMAFDNGRVGIERIGRYAGSKDAYEAWYLQFVELDQRQLRSLEDSASSPRLP